MLITLTREDKRLCRELIDTGLERECKSFVKKIQKIANEPIPLEELNEPYTEVNGQGVERVWHKRFIKLFRATYNFNKHVAWRYDGISGSHYLERVLGLYLDEWLTDEEISRFSEETLDYIKRYISLNT